MAVRLILRYCAAVVAVGLALAVRFYLESWGSGSLPTYITFYPVVMVVAVFLGLGPGIAATILSALTVDYWVVTPQSLLRFDARIDLIGMVLFLAMGTFMSVVAHLYRRNRRKAAAYDKERAVREQREWLRVTISSIGDAVLATDIGGRITFLNPVGEKLTGWTQDQAIHRPAVEVFRVIHETTRQPGEDIIGRVLREGVTVALANHTALVRADGTEVPIEDSAAPIKDSRGVVIGVVLVFHDVTDKRRALADLEESERRVRRKLQSVLSPEGDISELDLADLVDVESLQGLMKKFHDVCRLPMALIDTKGEVLVGVAWQRICTQFHRVNPEMCRHCIESDTELTRNVPEGEFRLYRCKNGLWDVATPVIVGGRHVGNLFTGQFLFDDEVIDREFFRAQARKYGMDEKSYLEALDDVPRMNRQLVQDGMTFLIRLANTLSQLSYSNVKLSRLLAERERTTANQTLLSGVLQVLNRGGDLHPLISDTLRLIREGTGFDAVGLRLRQGTDWPYFESTGFSDEFIREENSLCPLGKDVGSVRDADGRVVLECTCGLVLSGRVPDTPCFTKEGSFWTNESSRLLAMPAEEDPRTNPRNRCIHLGYESVGLFPIRSGKDVLGLLQLNSRQGGRFNPEMIGFCESLAQNMALALRRATAEEETRKTIEELRHSNEELERFGYITSHDLQEPLRQVRAFTQVLAERYSDKLDGRAAEYMRFITEGATRMSNLIQDLLAYSRVGSREVRRAPVSCQLALDRASANLAAAIGESGASITHDMLPTVLAEPTQLTQLFQNLVGNAVKFRREGVVPQIHVGCRMEGTQCELYVQDNGIGIAADHHEKIFMIFQRLHGRGSYAGTGIGLAICRKIVEQHGGRIWVESQEGKGSTFFFTMPVAGESQTLGG